MANLIDKYFRINDPSDIGYHVDRILEDHQDIDKYIKTAPKRQSPLLRSKLEGMLQEKYEEHKGMFNAASWLDTINRWIVAPVDIGGRALGALGMPLGYMASFWSRLVSGVAGLLYSAYYTYQTGDPKVGIGNVLQHGYSQFAPEFGGIAYTVPVNSKFAQGSLRNMVADEFRKQYMQSVQDESVIDLELERRKQQEPLEERVQPRRKAA